MPGQDTDKHDSLSTFPLFAEITFLRLLKIVESHQSVTPGKKRNYRKKRKRVFSGKRKQEQEQESDSEDLGQSSSSTPEKLNRSFEKIDNNFPLLKIERE